MTQDTATRQAALDILAAQWDAERHHVLASTAIARGRTRSIGLARLYGLSWYTISAVFDTTPNAIRMRYERGLS